MYGFFSIAQIVIPTIYDEIGKFDSEGIASVKLNGQYNAVEKLSKGISKVKNNDKYGALNRQSKIIILFKNDGMGYIRSKLVIFEGFISSSKKPSYLLFKRAFYSGFKT